MNPGAENELTVARLLGIGGDEAAERLSRRVAITSAGQRCAFPTEVAEQVERTLTVVGPSDNVDLEVVIDGHPATSAKDRLFVKLAHDELVVDREGPASAEPSCHRFTQAIAASYIASAVADAAIGLRRGRDGQLRVRFADLGLDGDLLAQPVTLNGAVLAGAGAIGNGFLRALRHMNPSGSMLIADPKRVGPGNPNRCLYFDQDSIDRPKAEELCLRAKDDFPSLTLEHFEGTFSQLRERQNRIRRVIVGTDSRRSRRTIQSELPLEVLDASTSGTVEVVIHSHRQPTEDACLSCIYKHVAAEDQREKDIAVGLGIDLTDMASGLIDERVARKILASHPSLSLDKIIGVAFDSLFRELCAVEALTTPTGEQILAPFAFVSNIAGALLAVELLRFDSNVPPPTNYFCVDPWREPNPMMRRRRPKLADCEFCSRSASREAMGRVWSDEWSRC